MVEVPFYRLVRRFPPRKKTCAASVLVVCSGIGLEIYNQATASWIRALNDSMTMYSFLAMMLVLFGLASGFLFGRAPKLFGLMIALTLVSYFSLALWSRLRSAEHLAPPYDASPVS